MFESIGELEKEMFVTENADKILNYFSSGELTKELKLRGDDIYDLDNFDDDCLISELEKPWI